MKFRIKHLLAALPLVAFLSGCDIVEGPKVDPTGFTGSTNKVLIEDFTGHMCGNCPRAHEQAKTLLDTYGDNLVVVAVHAGSFARVVPSLGYDYDFNTPLGTALEAEYQADNAGLPKGMVNRRQWAGKYLTNYADWGAAVSTVLAESPMLGMEISTSFENSSRQLDVEVNMEYFEAGNADHQLMVLITEDSIVAKQSDYSLASGYVGAYVHNHVLRTVITPGNYGVPVKGNTIFVAEQITKSFSITLPPDIREEHCHVVAYVLDNVTHEIYQVEESTLLP
jgi:hypothetical protein